MDDQEDIGTLKDTSGRTANFERTDIIYSKYCNNWKALTTQFSRAEFNCHNLNCTTLSRAHLVRAVNRQPGRRAGGM